MSGPILPSPPNGDLYLGRLASVLNAELNRKEPLIIGVSYVGANLVMRYRAPYGVGWVQAHVQSSVTGGMTYDPATYVSSTEVDCRADRMQTLTVAMTAGVSYAVFLVPVQKDGAGVSVKYDGQSGRPDAMAKWTSHTHDASTLTGTTLAATVVTSSLTTVGALASGSIAVGFGAINNAPNALTTGALTATTGHLGDAATNYAAFAADGELTLTGTARVLKHLVIGFAGIGLGTTAPSLTRLGNVVGYAFTVGDDGYFTTEIPPDWDSSTAIEVFIHNYTNATTGNIRFQATWSALPHGGTEAVDAPTHSGTLAPAEIAVPGTAKAFQEYSLGTIAAASLSDNDALFFLLSRVAKTSGSDPASEPVLILLELLYTANKLGLAT